MNVDKLKMGSVTETALHALMAEIRKGRPWQEVLADPRYPDLLRKRNWFSNTDKALMYRIVSVRHRNAFLDIGAGAGVLASSLATEYRQVYALEYKPEFIEFMKYRFAQDRVENVHLIRGNALEMPFSDASIDLAAVNGVLEWVPNFGDPAASPRALQLSFLAEVRRCLTPGGKVVCAIENRWYHWYLRGMPAHGEAPFATVLPRPIANLLNRIVRKRPYREHIYGYWGLLKLFREAGFQNVRLHLIYPSYYSPSEIYSMDGPPLAEYFRKHHSRLAFGRIAKGLSNILGCRYLLAFFGPAYYIEAQA